MRWGFKMLKFLLLSLLFSFVTLGSIGSVAGSNSEFDINGFISAQDSIIQTSNWNCNSNQGEFVTNISFDKRVGFSPEIGEYASNQRGCCSWHDGVCGCENGTKLCCDGTLSPTCKC